MPERIFKYHTTAELVSGVKELAMIRASASGTITSLKNSNTGFLKETGEVSQQQLQDIYLNARYEIFLRGQGIDGNDADETCSGLEATNPYLEKIMRVKTVHGRGNGFIGGGFNTGPI